MQGPSTSQPGRGHSRVKHSASAECHPADSTEEFHYEEPAESLDAINSQLQHRIEELSRTYRELEEVVSAADASHISVSSELSLRYLSPGLKRKLAVADPIAGQPLAKLAGQLDCPELAETTSKVLESGAPRQLECFCNGYWFSVHLRPTVDGERRVDGVHLGFTDITLRKEAQLSAESAHRYADKVLEICQEPMVVLTGDLSIHAANPAFFNSFGLALAEITGKSLFEIGDGQWDHPRVHKLLEDSLPRRRRIEGFELTLDCPQLGKRDLRLNCHRLDEQELTLISVHDITPDRQVDVLRDREVSLQEEVSTRRRLQEMAAAVLQSENMRDMLDQVMDASADLSGAEFALLQILGEDGDPELSAHFGFPADLVRRYQNADAATKKACNLAYYECRRVVVRNIYEDEALRPCLGIFGDLGVRALVSTPLVGRSGKLLGVITTLYQNVREFSPRDMHLFDLLALETADLCEWLITENRLRQSETRLRAQSEQLLANDRQKNQFLGLLGHELRNPLTVMRNSIQTLVAEEHAFVKDPHISEALALLERQSRHMTHLVNDLLDITRINNGKVVLRRERVSLPRCLEEALAAHRSTLVSRELELSVQQPDSAIYLDADPARLFQVLDNLLTNAIKFTQPGGSVHVAMERDGLDAVIRVRDTGIGIPAESLDSLFEPFTQVDNSLALHGLGLGLSLVKSLVELHGGEIRAYSDGEDQGSEFVIRWPLHEQQTEPGTDAAPPAMPHGSASPKRILVVDDMADIADSFARLLEVAGHEVLVAYDAQRALALARQHCPSVAFLDMAMPDMDGLELARRLREEFDPADLALVMISGYGQGQDADKMRAAGIHHRLLKPIEIQEVYDLLDSLGPAAGPAA